MHYRLSQGSVQSDFTKQVIHHSGEDVFNCYQCGKCSAGCPISYQMDFQPSQIMRMLQLGMKDAVMNSKAIWQCISCETCTTRCPRENDPAKVMDALRSLYHAEHEDARFVPFLQNLSSRVYHGLLDALEMGIQRNTHLFNVIFLENIRRHGRSFEVGLINGFNAGSGFVMRNILKGPVLLIKGKMCFLPAKTGPRRKRIRQIYERIEAIEGKEL